MADVGNHEMWFKPADGAWIFKAPGPWPVGRKSHYWVNDAQKAALLSRLGAAWRISAAVLLLILLPVFIVVRKAFEDQPWGYCVILVITLLIALEILIGVRYIALRRLIARLPRSDERITLSEQLANASLTRVKAGIALSAPAFVLATVRAFTVGDLVTFLFVMTLLVYFGAILFAKLKMSGLQYPQGVKGAKL